MLINDQSWPPGHAAVRQHQRRDGHGRQHRQRQRHLHGDPLVCLRTPITVHYATADGSATAGSDYTAASGDVTIPAGQTSATITVAVKGDRLPEPNETFVVNLSSPTNASIADGQGMGTILDNEPRISINNVSKKEGNEQRARRCSSSPSRSQPPTTSR